MYGVGSVVILVSLIAKLICLVLSYRSDMEYQGNLGFLSSMPPKLEDAGLEECALPIEGIQVYWHSQIDQFDGVCYLYCVVGAILFVHSLLL